MYKGYKTVCVFSYVIEAVYRSLMRKIWTNCRYHNGEIIDLNNQRATRDKVIVQAREKKRKVKLNPCSIRHGIKFKVSALHLISGAVNKEAPCPGRIRTCDEANQSSNFKEISPLWSFGIPWYAWESLIRGTRVDGPRRDVDPEMGSLAIVLRAGPSVLSRGILIKSLIIKLIAGLIGPRERSPREAHKQKNGDSRKGLRTAWLCAVIPYLRKTRLSQQAYPTIRISRCWISSWSFHSRTFYLQYGQSVWN